MSTIDTDGTDLEGRLAKVKEFVDTETVKTDKAVSALKEAEKSKKRESYNKANVLISELTAPDKKLIARLNEADTVIAAEEEKKLLLKKQNKIRLSLKRLRMQRLLPKKKSKPIALLQ